MFMIKSLVIGIALFSAFTFQAQAQTNSSGLFVEPMLTYENGETDVNYPAPFSNSTGDADGFGIGARLGFHVAESFFVAGDVRYSMPQFKDSSVNYDAESTSTNYGAVVGFQMPNLGLRVWGTYILGGELNPKADGNTDVKFEKATGTRVGVGFHLLSVSLNLEYQDVTYDDSKLENAGPFTGSFDSVELQNKSWIASVSFPMEF